MHLKLVFATVITIVSMILAGCGTSEDSTDIGTWSVTVEVVGEAPFKFTNEDAKKIGPVEIVAAQKDKDVLLEADTYTGILIYDFLSYIGVEEFSVISIEAADGYTQQYDTSEITEDGTGLCWMVNGEMLDEENGLIKLVNHGRGPKWWIKQVSYITIIK